MANAIDLVTRYMPLLDATYKSGSITARMDSPSQPFEGAGVIKVMKTSIVGLGTYSRATGYPKGDVTITWETMTLAASRGREFSIDRMDNEETLDQAFGTLAGEFVRTQVNPEVDAYRFAKYASWSGISTTTGATLTAGTILAALDVASAQLNADEVPLEGRVLYVSDSVLGYLEGAVTRMLSNENAIDRRVRTYNGMELVMVPQGRFKTAVDLDAGATTSAGGYAAAAGAKDINFMLIYPPAVLQATKLENMKIFAPEVNQSKDAWLFQYRLYHDAFVYDNKVDGIYLHKKA
ncbi:MAG: hypothetical protein H0W34_11370 [Pyrinomonadaceae bacterium]|nr:hypothetical protein [Pyrinomonadaceae bacterium]